MHQYISFLMLGFFMLSCGQNHADDKVSANQSEKNVARVGYSQALNPPMVQQAKAFLASLKGNQSKKVIAKFSDSERKRWDFWPGKYPGLMLNQLSGRSRELAKELLATGLSAQGLSKLEIIHALEKFNPYHSPYYSLLIFGEPDLKEPWGWRLQGHHTSFNFTMVDGEVVSNTPAFLGTQPLSHPSVAGGKEPLGEERRLAQRLYRSLQKPQRELAAISRPPQTYLPNRSEKADAYADTGLPYGQMSDGQKDLLMQLLAAYVENMESAIAEKSRKKIESAGLENVSFAFAGSAEAGQNHYYRVQGPTFIIEYDCVDGGNHIHSVWREYDGDFGEDILKMHYQRHKH